jgi:hypothetical protein
MTHTLPQWLNKWWEKVGIVEIIDIACDLMIIKLIYY